MFLSICCVTYNHKRYIAHAIEGFLSQKTDFDFEIIIADDASTDGTTEIIKEYERKYPDLIRGIYQSENQYSKGILPYPNIVWPDAKGKYVALCEGDDYWTDPHKLQKQVDFIENNEEYIACSHESIIEYDEEFKLPNIKCSIAKLPYSKNKNVVNDYTFYEVTNTVLFQSSALIFRNITTELPEICYKNHLWDVALFLVLSGKGKIKFFKEPMSIYRKHKNSLTLSSDIFKNRINYLNNIIRVYNDINKYFDYMYNNIVQDWVTVFYLELWLLYKKRNDKSNASFNLQKALNNTNKILIYKKILRRYGDYYKYICINIYQRYRKLLRQNIKSILVKIGIFIK